MLASKFRGCLLGALLGDCYGAPYEMDFPVSKIVLKNYFSKLLTEDGPSKILEYTDDTAMTLSVAKSIIENGSFNSKDMAERFVAEFYEQPRRGYGAAVVHVFAALKDSECSDVFGPAKLQFHGTGSYGNGAAMRIAPLALFGYNLNDQELKKLSKECALITHTHQNGYNGAILQCLAVHSALKLNTAEQLDPVEFINNLEQKMESFEDAIPPKPEAEGRPYCNSLKKMKDIFLKKQEDISPEEIAVYLGNGVAAHRSVPTAIYSFLRGLQPLSEFESSNPFVRTLYFAISVGGDTDTIASMAGSIAGAYHGADIIPKILKEHCESHDKISELAGQLFEQLQA